MPRILDSSFRQAIEASGSSELLLCFATITHPQLSVPVYAVADVIDYIYGGNRFYGVPFSFQLLTDSDRPPTCRISMQDVDRIISNAVLAMRTVWPRLKLVVLAGSDFGDIYLDSASNRNTRKPRSDAGPTVEYSADHLRITNVTGDGTMIQGEISSIDLTREPWPSTRATRDRLPGLWV